MRSIHKYDLPRPGGTAPFPMPQGAVPVRVGWQDGVPRLWALVGPDLPLKLRTFSLVGSGWELADNVAYIGSLEDGPFVWHVVEAIQ